MWKVYVTVINKWLTKEHTIHEKTAIKEVPKMYKSLVNDLMN